MLIQEDSDCENAKAELLLMWVAIITKKLDSFESNVRRTVLGGYLILQEVVESELPD